MLHPSLSAASLGLLLHAAAAQALPPGWDAVSAATLAKQRGGFAGADGLLISLGIERIVAINGVTVARSSVNLAQPGAAGAAQASQTSAALSAVNLIQNGSGNIYVADMSGAALGGSVIQNTLNDQRIDSRTTISASLHSSDLLSTLQFHGSLGDALARSAGP